MRPLNYCPAALAIRTSGSNLSSSSLPVRVLSLLWTILVMLMCIPVYAQGQDRHKAKDQTAIVPSLRRPAVDASFGKLPLDFEVNQGQSDPRVKFLARGNGYSLFFTDSGAVVSLRHSRLHKTDAVYMDLSGASKNLNITGVDQLPGRVSYLIGNNPDQWHSDIPTFAKVRYSRVYPGIDLVYYGNQRQLEYDFIVAPHAKAEAIRLRFAKSGKLKLDDDGDLHIIAKNGKITLRKPLVYQEIQGRREPVEGHFALLAEKTIGFH